MNSVGERIRVLIDENFELVVAALVVVALVGGYVAYTGFTPDEDVETRTVSSWESGGEFAHRATVINGTDAFSEGTVLRNRSVYFQRATPVLDGSFTYTYTASDGGDLTADTSLVLVVRSFEEDRDGNVTEYWRVEEQLDSQQTNFAPGDTVQLSFSRNVTAAAQRAENISEQLGDTPGQEQVLVEARVHLTGTRNGQQVNATRVYRLPMEFEQGIYRVDDPGVVTNSGSQKEQVTVSTGRDVGTTLVGGVLFALGLGGAIGLTAARREEGFAADAATRERFAYESERDEFDDWITTARLPPEVTDRPRVEVDSLEGLVDLAIDTDERVIETPDERFHVFHDGYVYVFEPPAEPTDEPAKD